MKRIATKLFRYFLQGLLIVVPGVVTVYFIIQAMTAIDGILPTGIPGLGIITILSIITLIGAVGSSFLAQPFLNYFDEKLEKTPGIKIIYSSIKDLMNAFVGKEKKFNKPVLAKLNSKDDDFRIGFITRTDLSDIGIGEGMVAVYFPHSYTFAGFLAILPKENITNINASSADVMKFVISGGVTDIDNK